MKRLGLPLTAGLALVLAAGCHERRAVTLDLGFEADSGIPEGFQCEDVNDKFLLERTLQSRLFSVRIDFLRIDGGVPVCRENELQAWCKDHKCERLLPTPLCIDAEYGDGGVADAMAAARDAFARLRDALVIRDAPEGVVVVRLIGTQQPCSESIINPDLAVGCARSCPIRLDDVSGAVLLTNTGLPRECETTIEVCSSQHYREQN